MSDDLPAGALSVTDIRPRLRAPRVEDWDPFFERLANGGKFKVICEQLGLHPATVKNRIAGDEHLQRQLAVAQAIKADDYAEKSIAIADGVVDGLIDTARGRVGIQAYQWAAAQLDPQSWGKSRVEVTGKDGKDLQMNNVIVFKLPDNNR